MVINLSSKHNNGNRLANDYVKTYSSSKFSDRSENSKLTLRPSIYWVLSYMNREQGGTFTSEEIFLSYPHLNSINETFKEFDKLYDEMYNELYFYDEHDQLMMDESVDFQMVVSDELAMGKRIALVPAIAYDHDDVPYPGIGIIFNEENIFSVITLDNYVALKREIKTTNMTTFSQELINFAAMSELLNANGGSSSSSSKPANTKPLNRRPSILGRSNATGKKPNRTKPSSGKISKKEKKEIDEFINEEEHELKNDIKELDDILADGKDLDDLPFETDNEDDEDYDQPAFLKNVLDTAKTMDGPESLFDDED